jgi:hypothetical protein
MYSVDGSRIFRVGGDGVIAGWNTETGDPVEERPSESSLVAEHERWVVLEVSNRLWLVDMEFKRQPGERARRLRLSGSSDIGNQAKVENAAGSSGRLPLFVKQ